MSRDALKRAAAQAALDTVRPGSLIGVGTGSTVNHFIEALGSMRPGPRAAVASSAATAKRLRDAGVSLLDLDEAGPLPLYVDGADEATRARMLIKGGGGALTREKILAAASARFICIIDESKLVERLGAFPLPIEVLSLALGVVSRAVERLGGRPAPRAGFVTDNGNPILDVHGLALGDPAAMESALNQIPGVVTNGLFALRPADELIVATPSGLLRL